MSLPFNSQFCVVFHVVRSFDAISRLRALPVEELQRRVELGSGSLGFIGVAAGLGLAEIVHWGCSLGLSDDVCLFCLLSVM